MVEQLGVVGIGGNEYFIGELQVSIPRKQPPDTSFISMAFCPPMLVGIMEIKDPKRFIRHQRMTEQGISVQYLVGDLDLLEAGRVHVQAVLGYLIEDQSVESQTSLLSLYIEFLEKRIESRAKEVGLHLPTRGKLR